jgi:hypothetical protein
MFGQVIKVWWMLQWRLTLLSVFNFTSTTVAQVDFIPVSFLISLLAAAVLVFGFRRTIYTFPLIRLLTRRPVGGKVGAPRAKRVRVASPAPAQVPGQAQASRPGRMTGYEPQSLVGVEAAGDAMVGIPGRGLASAGFGKDALAAGVAGELQFAQAMKKFGTASQTYLLDRLPTFWSVALPDESGRPDRRYKTDVDCVVVSGETIFLIDIKNYKSGDVTYRAEGTTLYAQDNATGKPVGEPKTMSRNMAMATERFAKLFPQYTVVPRVVFMPTHLGEATLEDVYWPDRIQAIGVEAMLAEVARSASRSGGAAAAFAASRIRPLVK